MFLKMQQLACPSNFPLWLKIIVVLRSQGLLRLFCRSCSMAGKSLGSAAASLWTCGSADLVSVQLRGCLPTPRTWGLSWAVDGGDCREQELPQHGTLHVLTGWFVRPKSCGQEKRLESAAGELHCSCSCARVLHEHLLRKQLLCDDGQWKHCFLLWCEVKSGQTDCPSDTFSAASRGKKRWI